MRRRTAVLTLLAVVIILLISPGRAPAQGQYEGWDLVLEDHQGYLIYLNATGHNNFGDLEYEGVVSVPFMDTVVEGEAYASQINLSGSDPEAVMGIRTEYYLGHGSCSTNLDAYQLTWQGGDTLTGLYFNRWVCFEEGIEVTIVHGSLIQN